MSEIFVHQKETTEDTESFLQENMGKFETDAMFLWKLMLRGERLTAKTVVQKYGKEPRRLRDLFIDGKCERQWVLNENGKRQYVEYFITRPHPPTKREVIARAEKTISILRSIGSLKQEQLFVND